MHSIDIYVIVENHNEMRRSKKAPLSPLLYIPLNSGSGW